MTSTEYSMVSAGIFILRVVVGVVLFAHGSQKVLGWFGGYGLKGTVEGYFHQTLGMPLALGYLGAFTEFLGSIALILGLLTQVAAVGLFIMLIVAIVKAHIRIGFFMNWGSAAGRGEGFEFTLTLAGACLALAVMGAGSYSLDALIFG